MELYSWQLYLFAVMMLKLVFLNQGAVLLPRHFWQRQDTVLIRGVTDF